VPSPVSGSRTPRFPLLPVWKQRAGGSYRTGTRPLRGARASGAYAGGTPAHPAQPSGARPCRGRFGGKPRRACAVRAPPARTRAERPRTRRNPQVRAFAGAGLVASPGVPSPVSGSRTPRLPLRPVWRRGQGGSHRSGFSGKPRRAISRFRQQDAQTPPSPLVGEGGRGDEGANAHGNAGASPPGTRPLHGARASGAHAGGTPAHPAQPSGARPCRGRFGGKPRRAIFRFRHQDAQTPPSPLVGDGGRGDEGQMRTGMLAHTSGAHALAGAGWLANRQVVQTLSGA